MGFVRIVDASVDTPTFNDVVAVRCAEHAGIAPRIEEKPDDIAPQAECAICFARDFGERMSYQVSEEDRKRVLLPILEAFAQYMEHHALLRARLDVAVGRLNLTSPGAGDALMLEWTALDARPDNAAATFAAEEASMYQVREANDDGK